jgi:Helix-turn-helix domain
MYGFDVLIQLAASNAVVQHRVVTFRSGLTAIGPPAADRRARRADSADEESLRRVIAVMTNDGSQENVIAERLNHLFETVHPPYTPREVADAINAQAGVKIISAAYLSRLQTGQRAEPSDSRLVAIARFFGVDIDYLSGR